MKYLISALFFSISIMCFSQAPDRVGNAPVFPMSIGNSNDVENSKLLNDVSEIPTDLEVLDFVQLKNGALYNIQSTTVSGYNSGNADGVAVIQVGSNFAVLQPQDNTYRIDWFGDTNTDIEINKAIQFASVTGYDVSSKANQTYTIGSIINLESYVDLDFATSKITGSVTRFFEGIGIEHATVKGFIIENASNASYGVKLEDCKQITLSDFELKNLGDGTKTVYGVYIENSTVDISKFVIDGLSTDKLSRGINVIDLSGEQSFVNIENGSISNIQHTSAFTDCDGIFSGATLGELPAIVRADFVQMEEITKRHYKTINGVLKITNSTSRNLTKSMFHFVAFQGTTSGSSIENCVFENIGGTVQQAVSIGVIGEGVSDIIIANNSFKGSYTSTSSSGVDIKNYSQNIKIQGNHIEGFQSAIGGLTEGSLSNSNISANTFNTISKDVIRVDSFYNNVVSNNIISNSAGLNTYLLTVYDNVNFAPSIFSNNIVDTDNNYRLIAGTGEIVSRFSDSNSEGGNIRSFASDAAADADATLMSGEKYIITGQREIKIKP